MKIVIFDTAPLTFLGGFEGNIIDLGRNLSATNTVTYITGNYLINNTWTILTQGHKCESRVSREYVNNRTGNLPIDEYGFLSLVPFTPYYFEARCKMQEADVVYGKNEIFDILIMKYWLLFSKKPPVVICGVHTPIYYPVVKTFKAKLHNIVYGSFIYRKLIVGMSLRFLTLNSYDQTDIITKAGLIKENVALIPNGIDTLKFSPAPIMVSNKFVVLFAGRLTEQKGVDTFSNTINILSSHKDFKEMEFWIAGTGELENLVQILLSKFNNVKWLRHVDDMPPLYKQASIFVAPSRWETFCFTVAEAQSCGLPVITTNIPGPKDIVNEKTGLIIEPGNDFQLSESIQRYYRIWETDQESFNKIKEEARNNIISNFSIEATIKATSSFFLKQINHYEVAKSK